LMPPSTIASGLRHGGHTDADGAPRRPAAWRFPGTCASWRAGRRAAALLPTVIGHFLEVGLEPVEVQEQRRRRQVGLAQPLVGEVGGGGRGARSGESFVSPIEISCCEARARAQRGRCQEGSAVQAHDRSSR